MISVTPSRSRILRALLLLVLVLVAHPTRVSGGHLCTCALTQAHSDGLAFDVDATCDDDDHDCACVDSATLIITTPAVTPVPPTARPLVAVVPDARVPFRIVDSADHPPRLG